MPRRKSDLNRRRRSSQAFQQFVERESESQRSRRLDNVRNRNRARNQMEAQVNRERHLEDSRSRVPRRKNLFREAFNYDPNFDYKVLDKVSIGLMNIRCEYCEYRRDNSLMRISETHRFYDSLQYPLIFWNGNDGYHFSYRLRNPATGIESTKKVSALSYYSYQLMIRVDDDNYILKFRQLLNQYVVDMYAKIESERLLFIKLHQQQLRSEEYIHLQDAILSDTPALDIGRKVVLPASFTGSPRHMHEYTQDAMTYVRIHGRPSLFITFTCNPTWKEIKDLLFDGQQPVDRHDVIARIFKQKLGKLMDVIVLSQIFGQVICWMYSVEWQKRGLPHAHILIWLKDKIQPTDVDYIISAELPDVTTDPYLFAVISKNTVHGPCGVLNPMSPCMTNGKCSKRYPRQLLSETQIGIDGYPLYRRRAPEENGFTTVIKFKINNVYQEITIDNKWIVP